MMTLVHLALAVLLAPNGATFLSVPVPPDPPRSAPMPPPLVSTRLGPGLHVLRGGPDGNLLVLETTAGVLLVDGQALDKLDMVLAAVDEVSDGPVRYVVNTHYHPDHVGANEAYAAQGAVLVSQEKTRADMTRGFEIQQMSWEVEPAPEAAWPSLTYADELTLHFGEETVRLLHMPAAHTAGDTVVQLVKADVIHTGDLFELGAYPFLDIWHEGSLAGLVSAVDGLLELCGEQTRLVPGHGPVSARSDLLAYRAMLATLLESVSAAVQSGQSGNEFLATRPTAGFDPRWGSPAGGHRLAMLAFIGMESARREGDEKAGGGAGEAPDGSSDTEAGAGR